MRVSSAVAIGLLPATGMAGQFIKQIVHGDLEHLFESLSLDTGSGLGGSLASSTDGNSDDNNAGRNPGANTCGASTFHSVPQSSQYLRGWADDCLSLADLLVGDSIYTVEPSEGDKKLASCKTCAFTASVDGYATASIGGDDIQDLLQDSVAQFHETGIIGYTGLVGQYVSASGEAGCDITPGDNSVQVNITWTVGRNGAFIPGSQGVPGIDAEVCGWNYEDTPNLMVKINTNDDDDSGDEDGDGGN